MDSGMINIDLVKEKNGIDSLKSYKGKLEELLTKIKKSKEDLVNSNLSGQTYTKCIEKNEYFEKTITQRIIDLNGLISKLELSYNIYNNYIASMKNSVNGGK